MGIKPVSHPFRHNALDEGFSNGIAELGFCLPFELRDCQLNGNHRHKPFAHIITGEVFIFIFKDAFFTGIPVNKARKCGAEAFFMGPAFSC